jgi:hypothetical protein
MKRISGLIVCMVLLIQSNAQEPVKKTSTRKHEMYFSWGYNKEWYTKSNVHIQQASLGNDYTMYGTIAKDHPGWDNGIFNQPLSIPQYNYRLGFLINREKDLFFEINFDHTKYIIEDQGLHIAGTMNNKHIDSTIAFNEPNGFFYYLNNGANFLLFNLVKRWKFYESDCKNFKLDGFGKAGIGPVIPHVENMLFGKKNDPNFQLGGWNIGAEAALRATFYKYLYLEFSNKLDYASYSGLGIYQGKAKQSFGTYEVILSLGVTFPYGKKIQ